MSETPEQVKVRRVIPQNGATKPGLWQRYHKVLLPIMGGVILDCADLATYGPAGLVTGMIVGCTVGWLISDFYDYSKQGRLIFAILAGVYCATPGTFFLPLATMAAVMGWMRGGGRNSKEVREKTQS
jgi:uncharacterized membrane protein YeaQ/YmgE (transglycosylase-associated protein family)